MSHIACGVHAEVFDTYTYSDVGFDGDACPPCIVMQPPVATLQTWMDAQDPTNPVWEEQVLPLYPRLFFFALPCPATGVPCPTPAPTLAHPGAYYAQSQLLVSCALALPLPWHTPPPPPSEPS